MVQYICGEEFYFDLDTPVDRRYEKLFPKYLPLMIKYFEVWIKSSKITDEQLDVFEKMRDTHPDRELIEDCEYFAYVSGISFKIVLFVQYMYDFGGIGIVNAKNMGCTSILVSPNNSQPYLIRNLDWDFNDIIRALTITAHYTRQGQIIMSGLAIVGQLSVGHTIKSSKICMSVNFLQAQYNFKELIENIIKYPNIPSLIRIIRTILINDPSYKEIENILLNQQVQHHGYISVVGRNRDEISIFYIRDFTNLNIFQQQIKLDSNDQYLIVTNGEYTKSSIDRLKAAQYNMSQLQSYQDSKLVVQKVARVSPNLNSETIFTANYNCFSKNYEIYI